MRASLTPTLALALSAWLPMMFPGFVSARESGEKMATLETIRKRVYQDVEVLATDPHGITFRHRKGAAKIPFEQLGEAIREKYKYDKEAALKFLREHAVVEPAPPARRYVLRRTPAYEFIPGSFTVFGGGAPVTRHGTGYVDAIRAARYVPPHFVQPVPVCSPFNLYLWRQLQLGNHLTFSRTHASHRVCGFESVASTIDQAVRRPMMVRSSTPAIGAGRGVPAIGAAMVRASGG